MDEYDELYDDTDDVDMTDEDEEYQATPTALEKIGGYSITHPRIALGGSSLLTSGIIDLFAHNLTVAALGVVISIGIGVNGSDLLKDLIPGADQEAARESAHQFADDLLEDYPQYADQSAGAKLKRLFGVKGKHMQLALPSPQKQGINTTGKGNKKEGLTLERVLDLMETGKLTDAQFFALIERLPDTNNNADSDAEDCDEDDATRTQNTPPNQPVEPTQDRNLRARQYRLDAKQIAQFCALYPVYVANKDKALEEVGANSSYRAHANEIIEEYKLLDKKRG